MRKGDSEMNAGLTTMDFNTLYGNYAPMVQRVASRFGFRGAACDDIVQEVFVRAWKKLDTLRNPAAVGGWLATIARNTCVAEIKRESGERRRCSKFAEDADAYMNLGMEQGDGFDIFEIPASVVHEAIALQGDSTRARVAKMFYFDGKQVKEICDELGLNQNTVLSHLRRFRLAVGNAIAQLTEEGGCAR